jgi:hypothetical protein
VAERVSGTPASFCGRVMMVPRQLDDTGIHAARQALAEYRAFVADIRISDWDAIDGSRVCIRESMLLLKSFERSPRAQGHDTP